MFEQTVVDPCGCVQIWNGQAWFVFPCMQNLAANLLGSEGVMEVAI